ncbi:MAG: hemolysin III family protein [Salaquimonas sp.]|nr:hemolysin III family protein [Salaquimonas sp.]
MRHHRIDIPHPHISAHIPERIYSRAEIVADGAIHAVGITGAAAGAGALMLYSAMRGGAAEITVAAVYLAGLMIMFTASAANNLWFSAKRRELLQGLDHAAIFVMIAGSYTPFFVLLLDFSWALWMTTLVWSVAAAGIVMRLVLPRTFKRYRVWLYLSMGWIGMAAAWPLMGSLDWPLLTLLAAGGIVYSTGVIFHVWTALPFQNAIWHAFVLTGASLHYAAVFYGVVYAG